MATYYRWERYYIDEADIQDTTVNNIVRNIYSRVPYQVGMHVNTTYELDFLTRDVVYFALNHNQEVTIPTTLWNVPTTFEVANKYFYTGEQGREGSGWGFGTQELYRCTTDIEVSFQEKSWTITPVGNGVLTKYTARRKFIDYVYSTNASAYPNNGVQDGFYYYRTTVQSPTAPTGLTYPNPITTPTVTVSWNAATSNVPDYPVDHYNLLYNTDPNWSGMPTPAASNIKGTSFEFDIPPGITQIKFWVYSYDTNGQTGGNVQSEWIPVYLAPTLTVPQMVMQGQQATVSWTAIDGADSYTLQRKSSADADWTQVYSGTNLTFSETVGTWTAVQYRVQAVFDGTPGGWAESAAIPVVSASSLVISGTDEDLGVVTNDIPYSISTDTGNQITATITVNNAVIFSGNVGNSTADVIPVLDLITGEGTIVISATVDASGSPVTATRTWTYEKAAITFPNSGSVAQVTKEGENIYPKVLAEGVRLPGGKTLDQVMGVPAQIYTGSYVGTGTSGASNPNTLTFPFVPKIVFIMKDPVPDFNQMVMGLFLCGSLGAEYKDRGYMYAFRGYSNSNNDAALNFPPNSQIACAKIDGNTLSWYSNDSSIQLNLNTAVYHYVALG